MPCPDPLPYVLRFFLLSWWCYKISSTSNNTCIPLVQSWYTTSNYPSLWVSVFIYNIWYLHIGCILKCCWGVPCKISTKSCGETFWKILFLKGELLFFWKCWQLAPEFSKQKLAFGANGTCCTYSKTIWTFQFWNTFYMAWVMDPGYDLVFLSWFHLVPLEALADSTVLTFNSKKRK